MRNMEKAHHTEALETMEAVEVKRHHMKATEAHHTEAHRHHWPRPSHLKREGRDRGDTTPVQRRPRHWRRHTATSATTEATTTTATSEGRGGGKTLHHTATTEAVAT